MLEGQLSSGLVAALNELPGFVAIKHNDARTAGIPDISLTGLGRTSWIEVKRGKLTSRSLQRLTLHRLHEASGGRAFYVLYSARGTFVAPAASPKVGPPAVLLSDRPNDHEAVKRFLVGIHKEGEER